VNERLRQGLAGLCATGLLVVVWLLVRPSHAPLLGESDTRWRIANMTGGVALLVGVVSLVVLIVGLLKPPPR
jgi:hypothetical protein